MNHRSEVFALCGRLRSNSDVEMKRNLGLRRNGKSGDSSVCIEGIHSLLFGILLSCVTWPVLDGDVHASERPALHEGLTKFVVGGSVTEPGQYPWMVALVQSDDEIAYRSFFSGAMLIHSEWILTAAHSVDGKLPAQIHAIVGGHHLGKSGQQRSSISEIVYHPEFVRGKASIGADLALLRLSEPLPENSTIPLSFGRGRISAGTMTRALGWGKTADRGFRSMTLRSVDIPVVSIDSVDVEAVYGQVLPSDIVLAGDLNGDKDTCDGDSGGPLLGRDSASEQWRLVAVVSGGSDRGCAVKGAFGLYTEIVPYLDWIESIVVKRFADWAPLYGLLSLSADADNDGFSNWEEYGRMTHPLDSRSYPRIAYGIYAHEGNFYPQLAGLCRFTAADLGLMLEASDDLVAWGGVADSLSESGNTIVRKGNRFLWRSPYSLKDQSRQFFRVTTRRSDDFLLLGLNPVGRIVETLNF